MWQYCVAINSHDRVSMTPKYQTPIVVSILDTEQKEGCREEETENVCPTIQWSMGLFFEHDKNAIPTIQWSMGLSVSMTVQVNAIKFYILFQDKRKEKILKQLLNIGQLQ